MKRTHARLGLFTLLIAVLWGGLSLSDPSGSELAAAPKRKKPPTPKLPDLKTPEDKIRFLSMIRESMPTRRIARSARFNSSDLDRDLERYVQRGTSTPFTPLIDDETFVRRATLDLTGQVPDRKRIRAFIADADPKKRSKLIDELLETEAYARKWARYWRSVLFHDSPANKNNVNPKALEDWLTEQFQKGAPWDYVVAELVSASPKRVKERKAQDNGWQQDRGPNNFILACDRKPEEIASQTARIFMGISIQCAECHDHPFDQWKREQFHEMAAFFAPGNYYMTDQDDPSEKTKMQARFVLGEKPPEYLKPDHRRVALAAYLIYNPDNYWFARAYVNRIWNELLGDGFYSVDSLGPDQEVVHQLVVNRIAANFRYAQFDPKWVFRLIMNTEAYQREIREVEETADLFTGVRPTRLRPYEVADNVTRITGDDDRNRLEKMLQDTFKANPSIPQRDMEGSIQQALLMMNNGTMLNRLRNSPLKKELVKIGNDRKLIEESFLALLARTPTDEEYQRYTRHLKNVKDRNAAVDDLMWVLVNSTEFLVRR